MKKKIFALGVVLVLFGASACVRFKMPDDPEKKLVVARDRLLNGAGQVKPNQAMQMRQQAAEMQKMIDAANAGAKLDPAEVDRIVERSFQQPY